MNIITPLTTDIGNIRGAWSTLQILSFYGIFSQNQKTTMSTAEQWCPELGGSTIKEHGPVPSQYRAQSLLPSGSCGNYL